MALVTLCDVLFYTSSLWKASSLVRTSKSYLLQLKKTLIFANAANSTELLSLVLHQGLNVRWLIHLVNDIYRNGRRSEGLVIKISAMLNSSLAIHYLSCLRSFTFYRLPRICHYRSMNLVGTLGSIFNRSCMCGGLLDSITPILPNAYTQEGYSTPILPTGRYRTHYIHEGKCTSLVLIEDPYALI